MTYYSRGGYTGNRGDLPTVTVRRLEGRMEYWEPELSRWIPVLTTADLREMAAEQERADDFHRNDHG